MPPVHQTSHAGAPDALELVMRLEAVRRLILPNDAAILCGRHRVGRRLNPGSYFAREESTVGCVQYLEGVYKGVVFRRVVTPFHQQFKTGITCNLEA